MLNEKLRELRLSNNMTQEQAAEKLGVSSQTVSKWERGLLSPDISLLPKIAELYECTIDSIFGMKNIFTMKHHGEIGEKLKEFSDNPDWESEYRFWLGRIEQFPEMYSHYIILMTRVLKKRAFDHDIINQMIFLTDYAEAHCNDRGLLDTIHFNMVEILGESGDEFYVDKLKEYHRKLPSMSHSLERLSKYVMSGETLKTHERSTIMFSLGQLTDSVLNLITPEMQFEEKVYYYKKSGAIIEAVTEGNYAGQYEIPLFGIYYQIALLLKQEGKNEEAVHYIDKIIFLTERHMNRYEGMEISKLLIWVKGYENAEINGLFSEAKRVLELIEKEELFVEYREKVTELKDRYIRYFNM